MNHEQFCWWLAGYLKNTEDTCDDEDAQVEWTQTLRDELAKTLVPLRVSPGETKFPDWMPYNTQQQHLADGMLAQNERLMKRDEMADKFETMPLTTPAENGFESRVLKRLEVLEQRDISPAAEASIAKYQGLSKRIDELERWWTDLHNDCCEKAAKMHAEKERRIAKLEDAMRPFREGNANVQGQQKTMLEAVNEQRELAQAVALKAKLSEDDAKELQRYRNHTPDGQPRYGTPEYEAVQKLQTERLSHFRPKGFA